MNKSTLLIIIFSLALFSCMSKDEPEVPLSYMKATVNGTEWKSESYGTDNPQVAIDKRYNDVNVVWSLPNWITPKNHPTFYLSMYYPIAPGKYTFNNNGINVPPKGVAVFIQGGCSYYSTSGYVEITHSGSFVSGRNF